LLYHSGRYAAYDRASRDGMGDHGVGPDHCVVADGDPAQHFRAGAYHHIVAYQRALFGVIKHVHLFGAYGDFVVDQGVGAYLARANFKNADLREADLTGAYLRGASFEGAKLKRANLSNTVLCECNFLNADLSNADLHLADLAEANIQGAQFEECNVDLADFSLVSPSHVAPLKKKLPGAILPAGLRGK